MLNIQQSSIIIMFVLPLPCELHGVRFAETPILVTLRRKTKTTTTTATTTAAASEMFDGEVGGDHGSGWDFDSNSSSDFPR